MVEVSRTTTPSLISAIWSRSEGASSSTLLSRRTPLALEMARHAPLQRVREQGDVLVLERRRDVELGCELRGRAAVRAVDHQRVEMKI